MHPVIHASFPNSRAAAAACGRISEYRTNPSFKRRVFTWDDLRAWETARFGGFRYLDYWEGFTFDGADLRPFREGAFDPLTPEERALVERLGDLPDEAMVIASAAGDHVTLAHEIVHVLYVRDAEYRRDVHALLESSKLPKLMAELDAMGYDPDSFVNEANAYLAAGLEPEMVGPEEIALTEPVRKLVRDRFAWDPLTRPTSALCPGFRTLVMPA